MKKGENKFELNNDILITHGEEALTFRKDDPSTQEYLDKQAMDNYNMMKENGKDDLWYGISLSNKRQDRENYENYKERLKTVKHLEKIYKQLGKEECQKQFPYGFAYALYHNVNEQREKQSNENLKATATIDGKEIPVIINNDKK